MAEASAASSSPPPLSSSSSSLPVHRLVWENKYQELDSLLANKEHDKEELDPRGR